MTMHGMSKGSLRGPLVLGVVLGSWLSVLAGGERAAAQEPQGRYITQASARLIKLVDNSNAEGYHLKNNALSVGGGWLKKGADTWVTLYTVVLQQDKSYRFLAAGDNDARDVDLRLLDANGKEVAADTGTNPEAIVNFQPAATGNYQVQVRLYDSRDNVPCVCLGVVMVK